MARRRRRQWFAAPLVVTTVAVPACSSAPKAPEWNVWRSGTACVVSTPMHCPRNATCNPPPPQAMECPPEMGAADRAAIHQASDGSCSLTVPGCTEPGCQTAKATHCPSRSDPWPAALRWTLGPSDDGARCTATPQPRTLIGWVQPAVIIDCPPLPDGKGIIMRATPDGTCMACPAAPCDPATAIAVPCPPDPPPP